MDPEIVEMFVSESQQLIGELEDILDELENPGVEFPARELREFSIRVDRMMGASKMLTTALPPGQQHLGLERIAKITELCKALGYRAAELGDPRLVPVFVAFWWDTIEVLGALVEKVADPVASAEVAQRFSGVLIKRLEWLAGRIGKGAPPAIVGQSESERITQLAQAVTSELSSGR